MSDQPSLPEKWQKIQIIGTPISSFTVPLLGLFGILVGHWYATAVKEKDIQTRYVELSLGILSQQPTDKTENIRRWAIEVINHYSEVKIGDETRKELLRERLQGASSPSRPVLSTFQTGSYKVDIPSDVENMWVFYQQKSKQSVDGCRRPPNADPISPKAVAERIAEFVKYTSTDPDIALIFTAFSRDRSWDAAASEIRINGRALKPMTPYWCNGVRNYGYELELR